MDTGKYINSNKRIDMYDVWRMRGAMMKAGGVKEKTEIDKGKGDEERKNTIHSGDRKSTNRAKTYTDRQNEICSYLVAFLSGFVVGFTFLFFILSLYIKR